MRGLHGREQTKNTALGSDEKREKERHLRILLVEDDDVDAKLIQFHARAIRRLALVIDRAATISEANDYLQREKYDLCIFDFWLGCESSLQLIDKLGGRAGGTPVIILTGLRAPHIRDMGFNAGAVSFLGKDHLAPATLEDAVTTALETSAVEAQLRQACGAAVRPAEDGHAKLEAHMRRMLADLNAIYACATMTRTALGSNPPDETRVHLSTLIENVDCLRCQLTDDLLTFRGSGPHVLFGRHNISDLIQEALQLAQGALDIRDQTVRFNRPEVDIAVECDDAAIYFLLHEIIQKLVALLPVGSAIAITTHLDGGNLFVDFLGHSDRAATITSFTINSLFSGILKDHCGEIEVRNDEGRVPTVSLRVPLRSLTGGVVAAA